MIDILPVKNISAMIDRILDPDWLVAGLFNDSALLRVCERIGLKSAESGVRRRKPSIRSSLLPSALRIPYSVLDSFTASQASG
jgi:hypothetical protein